MAKPIFGTLSLKAGTANTVMYLDASNDLVSSAVTDTELGYLDGVTSALQTQLDNKEGLISAATAEAVDAADTVPFTDTSDSNNTKKITFANFEAALNHDNLAGYVANEHIDHSAVSVATAADSGLTGGGDITTTRNLSVDITGTTSGTIDGADEILTYDVSGTALRKVTAQDIADLAAGHPVDVFKDTWATGDTATKAITHSLGTTDVMVQVFDIATGESIGVDTIDRTDANTVTVTASEAPPAGSWRVLILSL